MMGNIELLLSRKTDVGHGDTGLCREAMLSIPIHDYYSRFLTHFSLCAEYKDGFIAVQSKCEV